MPSTSASATAANPSDTGARIGALRIVLILLAVMIALPAFVMGAELNHALGAREATMASFLGGAVLACIAAMTGATGAATRKNTYMLIGDAFGEHGAKIANGILALSILGWYGVIAMLFGHALSSASSAIASHVPVWILVLSGCALTTATAMVGFRALDLLSAVTTPLKLILLIWTFAATVRGGMAPVWAYMPATTMPLGLGVSIVAGGLMVGAVLGPDICRFARSPWQAALGSALSYGIGFPLVLVLAGLPSLVSGEKDLVKVMITLGLGIPALFIVALTAWSTNAFNLYSATLIGGTIRPRQAAWQLALFAGIVGTLLGLAGISQWLIPYLLWLGVFIPPIAGIYLVNAASEMGVLSFLLAHIDRPSNWCGDALVAWIVGSGWAALAPRWGLGLTPVPAVDSIVIAAVVYAVLRRLLQRHDRLASERHGSEGDPRAFVSRR
jgi:cytosine permease